jgi:ATP-dependent HslUV protease ATP-binding subunit HslU
VFDALLPRSFDFMANRAILTKPKIRPAKTQDAARRQPPMIAKLKLKSGDAGSMEIFGPPGMEDEPSRSQGMFQNMGQTRRRTRKLNIKEALKVLIGMKRR